MNIVVIHGQAHQGNTWQLTQLVLAELNCAPADIQTFFVNGMGQCVGCCQCIMKDEALCPHRDQVAPLIAAIDRADVVILASPNYCFEMSGQLKSFCDHLAYRWVVHRPADLRGTIGIALSTTAGAGAGSVTKSLRRQMRWWSVGRVYRLSFAVRAEHWDAIPEKRLKKLNRQAAALARKVNRRAGHSTPCLRVRLLFWIMKRMHSGDGWNPVERDYWRQLNAR